MRKAFAALMSAISARLLGSLSETDRAKLLPAPVLKVERAAAAPRSVQDEFDSLLRRRGIRHGYIDREPEVERGVLGRRVTGWEPGLALSDGTVAGARLTSEPVLCRSEGAARALRESNAEWLKLAARGHHAATGEALLVLADGDVLDERVKDGDLGYLTFDPGHAGVEYMDGLPSNSEHNNRFLPVTARGQQFDHGAFHKFFLESGTFRRSWSSQVQVLTTGNWPITPAKIPDDHEGREELLAAAAEQADFVEQALFENLHGGFSKFIRESMYQAVGGNSTFVEIVHPPESDMWGATKKLSFRYPSAVNRWIVDDTTQELLAVEYINPDGETYVVDASDLLVYSYDAFGTDYEGLAAMRSIAVWIEILQLFSQLEAVAAEKFGSPWTWASKENTGIDAGPSNADLDELQDVIDAALAAENPIIALPDNTKLVMSSPAGHMPNFAEPKRFAMERVAEILKGEGSLIGVGRVGAFSARQAATDESINFAPYFGQLIADGLNGANNERHTGTIKKMVDRRFGGPVLPGKYPRLGFSLGEDEKDVSNVPEIVTAVGAGLALPSKDVIRHVHELLNIPPPEFDVEEAGQVDAEDPAAPAAGLAPSPESILALVPATPLAASERAALILADIDVDAATKLLDGFQLQLGRALRRVGLDHRRQWSEFFDEERRSNDIDASKLLAFSDSLRSALVKQYSDAAATVLRKAAAAGGSSLSRELKLGTFTLPESVTSPALDLKIRSVAEEAYNRLNGLLIDRFTEFARGEKTIGLPIMEESTYVSIAGKAVSTAFNAGRDIVMQTVMENARPRIALADLPPGTVIAERSSVLDGNTCDTCESLDGEQAVFGSVGYFNLAPPNKCEGKERCRCIWVYLLADDLAADLVDISVDFSRLARTPPPPPARIDDATEET